VDEVELLDAARRADQGAFELLVAPYQAELRAHCYRMLGAVHDADDALQDALLGAWRGLASFEGRASLRSWLYRIATNACLRMIRQRPRRELSIDHPPTADVHELGEPYGDWIEPYPDPQATYEQREGVELAFVAALQHLPGTQRAVLVLREVLAFSAAEVAGLLDTTVASVNSALQRARRSLDERTPDRSQQATLRDLGDQAQRELVERFVAAFEHRDVDGLLALLTEDARFTMPPLPAWFDGPPDIRRFLTERVFATPWRMVPTTANGQLACVGYQVHPDGGTRISGLNVLTLRGGRIREITSFLEPRMYAPFDAPPEL